MGELLEAIKRCEADGLPIHASAVPQVRAALERAELLEEALHELVKRIADYRRERDAFGARLMLDEAIKDAELVLAERPRS